MRDDFKDLDLRAILSAGVGRKWWENGDEYFKTDVGLGAQYDKYSTGGSKTSPIAQLTAEYNKKINKVAMFNDKLTCVPTLTDLGRWTAVNDASLAIAINEKQDIKIKLGVRSEYDNMPPDDVEGMDTYYYLNIVKDF